MKLGYSNPPHIRSKESNFSVMGDVIIALTPLYFMAFYFYGLRSVVLGIVSVLTCVIADVFCTVLSGRKIGLLDLSPVVTGMIIPLLLPATIEHYIVIVAGIFAIAVVKQPFGGLGQNIFNPAAAGVAFVIITWPTKAFAYPVPIEVAGQAVAKLVNSPAHTLKMGGVPTYAALDMLLGNFAGPMGATNILVLITCLIFLITRKTLNGKMSLAFLVSAAAIAFTFPRIIGSRLDSVFYELTSGMLLFGSIFLISDPTTSPKRESSKVVYAALCGAVTMLFRIAGGFEEGLPFAIILMNAFVWIIDMKNEEFHSRRRRARNAEQIKTAQ